MRRLCFLIALTAGLSLLYALQYYLGGPLQISVTSPVNDAAISPDGGLVAAASGDGAVRLWDISHGWQPRTLTGHEAPVMRLAFLPADATLVSADRDGQLRFWDMPGGQVQAELDTGDRLTDLALSADGSTLAVVGEKGAIHLWAVATRELLLSIAPGESVRLAVALSPDGSLVAAGDAESIQMWQSTTGAEFLRLTGEWKDQQTQQDWLGHEKPVTALAFSPDGAYLASGDDKGAILIWDVQERALAWEAKGHLGAVEDLTYDDSGDYLLSAGRDNYLRRWQASGAKFAGIFEGHLGPVTGAVFGGHADIIYSAGSDGSVRRWDAVNEIELQLVWTRLGLTSAWGVVFALWMLVSGLVGLLLAWGLWRVRTWGHLGALTLYLTGPLFTVMLPLFEITSYPFTWGQRFWIAWPLLLLLGWYAFLVLYLRRDEIAIPYQAPGARSLAEQLMAARRSQGIRHGLSVLAAWLLIFVLLFSMLRRFGLDVAFMRNWLPFIMGGAGLTLFVSALAIVLATFLALIGALGRLSGNPLANGISGFYVSLIRGTPLLVQIFIWFLALPQVGLTLPPLAAGILALGVNYGAYMTEIFRAGIQAIGIGQYEAAQALGMSTGQTFRRIVLPQAFRIVIPPIGNEFIAMMKDSSLVSIITVQELTFRAQKIGRQNFRNLETFLIAAGFYWILTIIFQYFQGKLETYMARGERR